MQNRQRGIRGAEPRTPSNRPLDINRERLVFCVSNLVGQRVTAKLRDNIIYEGLFHGCSLDGDYSITLKLARKLPTQDCKSGEVIPVFVIPGKDFLQVSAVGVPSPTALENDMASSATERFTTDAEIASRRAGQAGRERDLVPWQGEEGQQGSSPQDGARESGLEESGREGWDQFEANGQKYGVQSTYNEELYTTKLDPSKIPKEVRESAERIAREIESGQTAEIEGNVDGEEDEEGQFSAVQNRPGGREAGAGGSHAASSAVEQVHEVRLTKEFLSQHDSQMLPEAGFAREHRAKRGMITAHSPMRSPLISEMKRINALNLEPALPKLDDKTRNDWINFKQSQTRQHTKPAGQGCLKQEFQQSLEVIQKREASKHRQQEQAVADSGERRSKVSAGNAQSDASGFRKEAGNLQPYQEGMQSPQGGHGSASESSMASKSFSFNVQAKEFNPHAPTFTPSNPNAPPFTPQTAPPQQPQLQPQQNAGSASAPMSKGPQFTTHTNHEYLRLNLDSILKPFFEMAKTDATEMTAPDWPEATGPSYARVLGQPSSSNPPPAGGVTNSGTPGWQQPGQMPQGAPVAPGGPQMMQQGFMVAAPGGQPGQMYPQMYPASGGVPRGPQNSGNVGTDGQPCMQVFSQQGMMGQQPSQSMAMPGMGGQNMPMSSFAKFGGQAQPTMVVPMVMGGQYAQGFVPPVQGQGGQGQGPMMQQPMYRQMGGGPSHQMSGHD